MSACVPQPPMQSALNLSPDSAKAREMRHQQREARRNAAAHQYDAPQFQQYRSETSVSSTNSTHSRSHSHSESRSHTASTSHSSSHSHVTAASHAPGAPGVPHASGASAPSSTRSPHINVADERAHAALLQLLGCVLSQLVAFEEQTHPQGRGPVSMFHTAYVPAISISAYLRRVALYAKVSGETLLQAVLHIHQLMQRPVNPLIVNRLNVHRLLLTAIMSTAKFFDDAHYNNKYFAYVGGVPLRELNALEVEFLSLLNFDFFISSATYSYFYGMVIEPHIHQNGCQCPAVMDYLPKTVVCDEYVPNANEQDLSVPMPLVEEHTIMTPSNASSSAAPSSSGDVSMDHSPPTAVSASVSTIAHPSSSSTASTRPSVVTPRSAMSVMSAVSSGNSSRGLPPINDAYRIEEESLERRQCDAQMSEGMGAIRLDRDEENGRVVVDEPLVRPSHHHTDTPVADPSKTLTPKRHHSALTDQLSHMGHVHSHKPIRPHVQVSHPLHAHRSNSPRSAFSPSLERSPISSTGSYSSNLHSRSSSHSYNGAQRWGMTGADLLAFPPPHSAHSDRSPSLSHSSSCASSLSSHHAMPPSLGSSSLTPRQTVLMLTPKRSTTYPTCPPSYDPDCPSPGSLMQDRAPTPVDAPPTPTQHELDELRRKQAMLQQCDNLQLTPRITATA